MKGLLDKGFSASISSATRTVASSIRLANTQCGIFCVSRKCSSGARVRTRSVCGSQKVKKALTAPALSGTRPQNRGDAKGYANHPDARQAAELLRQLSELRRHIEANADDVGDAFAEEARKIHYREAPERAIRGLLAAHRR